VATPLTSPRLRIPNLTLALLRELQEYSQQDLADRLTEEAARRGDNQTVCDVRVVRRWENGDVVWPQEKYRVLLERVFSKPASELGFVRRWTRTPLGWTLVSTTAQPQAKDDASGLASEQGLLDLSFGFSGLLSEREETWLLSEVSHSVNGEKSRRIGIRHVERTERLAERINSLDHSQGGGAFLRQAINGVRAARALLEHSEYSEEVGTRLEIATGEMLIQAGWLAYDSGLQQLSRRLYTEAFVLGKVSRHDEITAHALSNMSIQANALGHPKDAVKFAKAAQCHVGPWATPRVCAVFTLHEARGLASLKASPACDAALAMSTSYFDAGPQDEDPNWIGYLNEEELASLTGVCLMDLGRIAEADELLQRGIGNLEKFTRDRSSSAISYMRGRLLGREIEQACTIGNMALPAILRLSSARVVNQFQRFREDLQEYSSMPIVDEFLGSVRAQMTDSGNWICLN
jgi:transcriptional regulator with XRE-family HTH domain